MPRQFSFKSYCWNIGTTSFRVDKLNFKIEKQLQLLKDFWDSLSNDTPWDPRTQTRYYALLQENNLAEWNARLPDKDAREKTSGLVQLWLLTKDRRLTEVWDQILEFAENWRSTNELFKIESDSYLYLLQFLKLKITDQNAWINIKPFLALIYALEKLDYLSSDEFTYLLPLCKTVEDIKRLVASLRNNRWEDRINEILIEKIMWMANYQAALLYLFEVSNVDENTFMAIWMNRKSSTYDIPYYRVYSDLYTLIFTINGVDNNRRLQLCENLHESIGRISWKQKGHRKKYFNLNNSPTINNFNDIVDHILTLPIGRSQHVQTYKKEFFELLHLFKWKSTLEDYYDLNRRYFLLTDLIKFQDNRFTLDLLPKYYFRNKIDRLLEEEVPYENYEEFFTSNKTIEEISVLYSWTNETIIQEINQDLWENLTLDDLRDFIDNRRLQEFRQLISSHFSNDTLISIMDLIENRNSENDRRIQALVTDNANIPTIFEYLIWILWYKISWEEWNILKFMNLSLDANLLPKTHAWGWMADIVYKYHNNTDFPQHDLLIEATISESTWQRNMEMEPVQRHLWEYRLLSNNNNDYCVFIASNLQEQLILAFRNMRNQIYWAHPNYITGLKIIPINTNLLKIILRRNISYRQLFILFEQAYSSRTPDIDRFRRELLEKIEQM